MKRTTIKCVILAWLLVSCASVSEVSRQSESLAMSKGYGAAVQYLKQQEQRDPKNTEIQTLLPHYRDVWLTELLIEADQLRGAGNYDDASQHYQAVLNEDPNNSRALQGLGAIKRDQRHALWVQQARDDMTKNQPDQALLLVKQVLDEDPHDADAAALKQVIDEQHYHDSMVSLQLKTAFKQPISLEFRDQSLRSIFEVISRTANINFIFDRDMPSDLKATIFARNTTVEDALRVLLMTNRLDKKLLNDNTVLIYQNTPDKQRDYQELVTKAFYINYADIKQTLNLIKLMVKTNDVYIDERLNMIVMRDTPEAIRIAEKLIAAHDLPDPEVVLDIQVLQVDDTHAHALGLTFPSSISAGLQSTGTTVSSSGTATTTGTGSSGSVTAYDLHNLTMSNITITGLSQLLALSLQESDSSTHTLANPRVRVKNKEKAKILIGDKIPIVTTSTANTVTSSSVQYQDVGLKLDAEPVVHIDNSVTIKLSLEVSSITQTIQQPAASGTGTNTFYQIGTRSAETVLQLRDGETEVLAGLISHDEANTNVRIPGLGDVPVLGRVFGSNTTSTDSNEIVLLVTPHVVRSLERPAANITEFPSGTASQITDQPLRLNSTEKVSLEPQNNVTFPTPATPAAPATPAQTQPNPPAVDPAATASVAGATPAEPAAVPPPVAPAADNNGAAGRVSLLAPASVTLGWEFTVALQLDGQRAMKGLSGRIKFPAGQVEVASVIAGSLMSGNGQPVTLNKHVDNGSVGFDISNAQSILGSGPVLNVVFRVLQAPPTGLQFSLDGVTATDPVGQSFGLAFGPPATVSVTPQVASPTK